MRLRWAADHFANLPPIPRRVTDARSGSSGEPVRNYPVSGFQPGRGGGNRRGPQPRPHQNSLFNATFLA